MTTSTKDKFLEELRELYRKKDIKTLERKYKLGKWKLTPEKRQEIERVIYKDDFIQLALNMGCKVVDKV